MAEEPLSAQGQRPHSASTSQISSVGFTNLKKLNTNSSVSTASSTVSISKQNPLTRLFTRNKSNVTIDEPSQSDDDDNRSMRTIPISPIERKASSNVFRLSKM
ncbi:hypothetical protein CANTEDRAFT_114552, partial [Yamadazyma tenuis ATCC 10573]